MKVSIHFSLAPGKASDLPIRMRISYDGIRLDIRTGFVCPPAKWVGDRMKANTTNRYGETASEINSSLSEQESVVLRILRRHDLDGEVPASDTLKREFEEALGRKPKVDKSDKVIDLYRQWLKCNESSTWSVNTARLRTVILSVYSSCQIANVSINSLSLEDINMLYGELIGKGLENQSVNLYANTLKTFLGWAKLNGLYSGNLQDLFRNKLSGLGKKDIKYLEWHEFERLFNFDYNQENDRTARDAFCLCCATGLRISDCLALEWKNVDIESDAPHLSLIAKKTKKPTTIELNKYSMSILKRLYLSRSGSNVFQNYNYKLLVRYLGRIAKMAGLDRHVRLTSFSGNTQKEEYKPIYEVITSHWGRHTFIVHALALGIAPTTIMAWTGHSSYDSMKPYIDILDKTKRESMSKFDL